MAKRWLLLAGLAGAGGLLVAGTQVPPARLSPHPAVSRVDRRTPLPDNLPAPVRRYLQTAGGDPFPVTDSAALWGRASMTVAGPPLHLTFRQYFQAGRNLVWDAWLTWFGRPVLAARDCYVDGAGVFGLAGRPVRGPKVNQGGALRLWAETFWTPSVLADPPAARWQAVDATTARLVFTVDGSEEELLFHFDAETGLLQRVTALRYRGGDAITKTSWSGEVRAWGEFDGIRIPIHVAASWGVEPAWLEEWVDGIAFNVEVDAHLRS